MNSDTVPRGPCRSTAKALLGMRHGAPNFNRVTDSKLSRREVLALLGGVAGLATVRVAIAGDDPAAALRRIGRYYLARFPDEANAAWLRTRLGSAAADFRTGDTLWLNGWLLARSEARLCALAALAGG